MTYKGTNKIGYVIDEDVTNRERVATHMSFDKAHITMHPKHHPPMAVALQNAGYRPEHEERCDLKIKLLSKLAKQPIQTMEGSAAFDIHSTVKTSIAPGEQKVLGTGVSLQISNGYHGQLHVRSS